MSKSNFSWDASTFFERLTKSNKFAKEKGFSFHRVSSLTGFEDCLAKFLSAKAIVAVSDESEGSLSIDNSPHTRRIKTVFLAMRHQADNMLYRQERLDDMRELFRQFMSMLILEKTQLEQQNIYLDTDISFTEINKYFFSGCACAFFQIATYTYTDLRFNPDEWSED
jgi:hypothetical protein